VKVFRPNFTDVRLEGDTVRVNGRSDADVVKENLILDIRVTLVQQETKQAEAAQFGPVGVDKITSVWHANVPSEGFVAGPAFAFGVETRSENSTTITWVQPVEILA
jgi:hypothetical protein